MRLFPANPWLNLAYPTLMFGLWHLAPLSVRPKRLAGGSLSYVAYAFLLGATYALAALLGSPAWVAVSHAIHDSLGLGARAYDEWLSHPAGSRTPVHTRLTP